MNKFSRLGKCFMLGAMSLPLLGVLSVSASVESTSVNVTVPASTSMIFNADGSNTISNFYIQNDMLIPIKVENISVSGSNGWSIVGKDTEIPADTKSIALSVGGVDLVSGSNAVSIDAKEESKTVIPLEVVRGAFSKTIANEKAFDMVLEYSLGYKDFNATFDGNGYTGTIDTVTVKNGTSFTLPVPNRTGYTFNGWYDSSGVLYSGGSSYVMPIGGVSFTASWTANTYTIVYDGNQSSSGSMSTQTLTYDKSTALSSNTLSKKGYTFAGWNTNKFGLGTVYTDGQSVKNLTSVSGEEITLYAQWKRNTYDTTVVSNDGNSSYVVSNPYGGFTDLGIPSKTGYTFKGWSSSIDTAYLGRKVVDSYIKDDKTFNYPTYSYRYGGGDVNEVATYGNIEIITKSSDNDSSYSYEAKINCLAPFEYHSTGKVFYSGFYTSRNIDSEYKENTTYIHVFRAKVPKGVRLQYAHNSLGTNGTIRWLTSSYGTGEWETYAYEAKLGTSCIVNAIGYIFIDAKDDSVSLPFSWNLAWNKIIEVGADESADSYVAGYQNNTVTANFRANTYTINFDGNGSTGGSTASMTDVKYGASRILTTNGFTKDGYTFGGWNTDEYGTGQTFTDGQSISNLTSVDGGVVTLYAMWVPNSVTATINVNGGSARYTTVTDSIGRMFTPGVAQKLGYSFDKYTLQSGAKGYVGNAKFEDPYGVVSAYNLDGNGNVTVVKDTTVPSDYASYSYKITTKGTARPNNGGFYRQVSSKANGVFVHTFLAKLPKGNKFTYNNNSLGTGAYIKWITDNKGTGEWQWYAYEVHCGSTGTFSTFGFVSVISDNVYSESNPLEWWLGWNQVVDITDGSGVTYVMGSTDDTVTANYSLKTYSLGYNLDGGTVSSNPTSYNIESASITLNNPTKTGYTFTGWSEEIAVGGWQSGDLKNAGNYNIYNCVYYASSRGAYYSEPVSVQAGVTYSWDKDIGGGVEARFFNKDGKYISFITDSNGGFTPTEDGYVRFLIVGYTTENASSLVMKADSRENVTIPKGSVGSRTYTANYSIGSYYLDLNGILDGVRKKNIEDYGIVDTYVNGTLVSANKSDFFKKYDWGTPFEVTNARPKAGRTYGGALIEGSSGTYSLGSLVGTIKEPHTIVMLKFDTKKYPITYNLNGGSVSGNPTTYNVDTESITLANPTKTGYTFSGWTEQISVDNWEPGDLNGNSMYTCIETSTRGAYYSEPIAVQAGVTYSWTNSPNGKTVGSRYYDSSGLIIGNVNANYSSFTPTKDGYIRFLIVDYDTTAGSTFKLTSTGRTTVTIPKGSTGVRSYTANWEAVEYSITFDVNSGKMPSGAPTTYTVESGGITLPVPTRSSCTFEGWYESEDFSGNPVTSIEEGSVGDKTYYAKWSSYLYLVDLYYGIPYDVTKIDLASTIPEDVDSYSTVLDLSYGFSDVSNTCKAWYDDSSKTLYIGDSSGRFKVESLIRAFKGLHYLTDISALANLDTSDATGFNGVFSNCISLKDISALANWDTTKVVNMSSVFAGCNELEDISALANWDTSKVTNMDSMFSGCSKLVDLSPLSNWNTSKVSSMDYMFSGCSILKDISYLSNWDVSKLYSASYMFFNSTNLGDISSISNWNTVSLGNASYMFLNCSSLTGEFTVKSNITSYINMFYKAATNVGCEVIVKYIDDATKTIAESLVATANDPFSVSLWDGVSTTEETYSITDYGLGSINNNLGSDTIVKESIIEEYSVEDETVDSLTSEGYTEEVIETEDYAGTEEYIAPVKKENEVVTPIG